jgi:hypothetical protein
MTEIPTINSTKKSIDFVITDIKFCVLIKSAYNKKQCHTSFNRLTIDIPIVII